MGSKDRGTADRYLKHIPAATIAVAGFGGVDRISPTEVIADVAGTTVTLKPGDKLDPAVEKGVRGIVVKYLQARRRAQRNGKTTFH